MDIAHLRKEYTLKTLDESDVHPDPLAQFNRWFEEATQSGLLEPSAMNLATVGATGRPSSRIVLLKGMDHGFLFFTNYESRKGEELLANPFAALTFHWTELERQVRIEGRAERVEATLSSEYFASRPKLSQLGAIASPQSRPIANRQLLETEMAKLAQRHEANEPARPEHWGGYRLLPDYLEFWQGRRSRLHDRIVYSASPEGGWAITRLAP
jgi:pyridoxamine 5'-phosphate oxidase